MNTPDDFELRARLRALSGDRPPETDLWPAIAGRLPPRAAARRPAARVWPWAMAAGLVLALTAWVVSVGPISGPDAERTSLVSAVTPAQDAADEVETLLAGYAQLLVFEAGLDPQHWVRQRAQPGGIELLAASRELDVSLRDLAAALRIEPHSQLLRRLIHQTLHQRLALSRQTWLA